MATTHKRIALAIALIAAFVFLIIGTFLTYTGDAPGLFGFLSHYHIELMVLGPLAGIAVGAFVFYLMAGKVEKTQADARKTAEIVLKFLSTDEKRVVQYLISHNGRALQSQLSHLEGLTRLKAHRMITALEKAGILTVERVGKVNEVTLATEVRDALVD